MCRLTLLLAAGSLFAGDERQALLLRAEADFERVYLSATPRLAETQACMLSQAALLPVSAPWELSRLHFRRGYCALTGALITREPGVFGDAARAFDQAAAAWAVPPKAGNAAPQPVPSGLRLLSTIAVLEGGAGSEALADADRTLAAAGQGTCAPELMPVRLCQDLPAVARQWRGWIAVRQNRLEDASRYFDSALSPGWAAWVRGQLAFDRRAYTAAAADFQTAVKDWSARETAPATSIPAGLAPRPEMASALVDLGGAQLLAGDPRAAIRSLDAGQKRDASASWPFFLRARAREEAGEKVAALADYNLASRTAFAEAGERAAGEAHLYRGVWLFRRHDTERAEAEFASALNFAVGPRLRPDAVAWRSLAAVAAGSCGASRDNLEKALPLVSPFFPKEEALADLAAACPTPMAAGASLP